MVVLYRRILQKLEDWYHWRDWCNRCGSPRFCFWDYSMISQFKAIMLHSDLGSGFKHFYFHPYLGKIPILTNIFQRGWNHQLVIVNLSIVWVMSGGFGSLAPCVDPIDPILKIFWQYEGFGLELMVVSLAATTSKFGSYFFRWRIGSKTTILLKKNTTSLWRKPRIFLRNSSNL